MGDRGPTDRALARAILEEGDEAAFRALYRRHTPYLMCFTLRILGGARHDAEDVVQESWIRAASALDGFEWRSTFRSWITGIALNRARDRLRRPVWETEDVSNVPLAEPPASVPDRIDLERAIVELPDGYRTVFVLHDVEGFSHREIGERLGIEEVTSRSQLSRARNALRALLSLEVVPE